MTTKEISEKYNISVYKCKTIIKKLNIKYYSGYHLSNEQIENIIQYYMFENYITDKTVLILLDIKKSYKLSNTQLSELLSLPKQLLEFILNKEYLILPSKINT